MAAVAEDIGGFRLTFAVGAAVLAVMSGVAAATWVGALLLSFHTSRTAFLVPLARQPSCTFHALRRELS